MSSTLRCVFSNDVLAYRVQLKVQFYVLVKSILKNEMTFILVLIKRSKYGAQQLLLKVVQNSWIGTDYLVPF